MTTEGTAQAHRANEGRQHDSVPLSDGLLVTAVALFVRLIVVAWAAFRIPPAADGLYYQRIAERIAAGHGYTWVWPDGAVTYAAHYPIGYPAIIGAAYAVFGPHPVVAMTINAFIGALGALAAHRLLAGVGSRWIAFVGGLLVAIHPGLVAYTPAIMTEGVTASLVITAALVAAWIRERQTMWTCALLGLVVGIATLVRPQSIVLAPAFALFALATGKSIRKMATGAAVASLCALLTCAPWTARNCVRMQRCALVSVNGGWNLLIGADEASTGAWAPVKVPAACLEVFDEAQKDVCFGREARKFVLNHPRTWLGLMPKKLAATFDFSGAASYYLHAANPSAFPYSAQAALVATETVYERTLLLLCLVWAGFRRVPRNGEVPLRRWARAAVAGVGIAFTLLIHAWVAYLALPLAILLRGRSVLREPMIVGASAIAIVATAMTHAIFFGAGRYSMVVFPLVSTLAVLAFVPTSKGTKPAGA